ncbi:MULTISPECIES: carbohydrate ABC transporter permease [Pacificibacter]|uniref:carbohydrate ABC transporter permease n=1 Tax=Pacificibacter TaxID=1042323 RepID=UPI001C09D7FA|nr:MULTISPECIES: carbohydrate ABC transporter permease [Pacificibacter]MBU2935888.1 carbohydrate ABC transporter permease [Pacificibacter marinus]MDO6614383.1 carbohydrate ABC transporter permease [Pacificibacter sp. 1_MG-2023]
MNQAVSKRYKRTTNYLIGFLVLAVFTTLAPFVYIAMSSFKTQISLLMGDVTFTPTLMNYNEVLFDRTSDYLQNFTNSVVVTSISTSLVVVIAFFAGYSLFRMRWPTYVVNIFLIWSMAFNLIPSVTLASAWYDLARSVGLNNDYIALILAHMTLHLPMALWLLASFFREIPRELEDAAYVDGASFVTLVRRVVTPLMMPGLMATGILIFVFSWNEFPVALALTNNDTGTVPVAIAKYAQEEEIKYTQMAAASVLSALPALLVLLFGQRFIVRGLTAGAVK